MVKLIKNIIGISSILIGIIIYIYFYNIEIKTLNDMVLFVFGFLSSMFIGIGLLLIGGKTKQLNK